MTGQVLGTRSATSARALLLTFLGEFVLPTGGSVWTSTLVKALGLVGVQERNARQANARLAEQQLLTPTPVGRRVRWTLTADAVGLLSAGAQRIYDFGANEQDWDGRWLIVLYSIPEEHRAKRHHLRTRLGFSGFGFPSPGVAMSPHQNRAEVAGTILAGLAPVDAFVLRAEAGDPDTDRSLLRRAWDLERLAASYREFVAGFRDRSTDGPKAEAAALLQLVHAWRRFPFIDPEIPSGLLPASWPGRDAKALFDDLHSAWSPGAELWFRSAEESSTSD